MAEVLSQVLSPFEIDLLLTRINSLTPLGRIEVFESALANRKIELKKSWYTGETTAEIKIRSRVFYFKDGELMLADIERKSKELNMGIVIIPNTSIKLINYSICPNCKTVFPIKDLMEYYNNPKPATVSKNRGHQIREDARVCCSECTKYFLPALVLSDGRPENEVQFLSRDETVIAIEKFFLEKGQKVLSRNKDNIIRGEGYSTIRNDVELQKLESKPTLISNMLYYTPLDLMANLIDGTNVEKGDILFGKWMFLPR